MPDNKDNKDKKEVKKSKYFRDPSEKPKSKYIKEEGETRRSKYFKTEEDRKAEREKSASRQQRGTSYRRDASSTNLTHRERRTRGTQGAQATDVHMPVEISSLDEATERKGDHTAIFTNKKADKDAYKHYKEAEQAPDDSRRVRQIIKIGLINIGLLVIAIGLNFLQFSIGKNRFIPDFLSVEFSVIPEFIGALAYGPVVGVVIALVKNVIHMIATHGYASELSNFVLDSFFIFIAGWVYTRRMFNFKSALHRKSANRDFRGRDIRARRILLGGFIGSVTTTIACFFSTRYMAYPILLKVNEQYGFSYDVLFMQYQKALDNINAVLPAGLSGIVTDVGSLSKCIVLFNLPITFVKFIFITLVAAVLYPPISDFLHNRVSHRSHGAHHSGQHHGSSHHSEQQK